MKLCLTGRCLLAIALLGVATVATADEKWGLRKGTPQLKSAGPLAFGPDGILLVGDTKAATVFAIATGDTAKQAANVALGIDDLKGTLAEALQTKPASISVNDLAVNPISGNVYLSVTKEGTPVIVRIDAPGEPSVLSLKGVEFTKVTLPDAPEDKVVGQGRRQRNMRNECITDMAYVDGKVIISGLAKDQSPSTIREIAFPFNEADPGARIEIYHGAHGRVEDYAAPRTFVPFVIDGEPNLLAGFTCTPLVKFPLEQLKPGLKVRGTTVAELGNRNRPLDMIVYEQDGKKYLLLANSARGVMKISTENIEKQKGITQRIAGGGTAGQPYETIEELQGVIQLDKINDTTGVVIIQAEDGKLQLKTILLP